MRRAAPSIVACLLALGAGLAARLWHVLSEPLWLDEAYSAFAAGHDFRFLWQVVPRYETHPPFYYSLLHLWVLIAGDGVAALRLPGVVAGIAVLPLAALAANEAGRSLGWDGPRRRLGAAVAFALACVAVQPVEMTRQVRPYPLMILAYTAATLLLVMLHRRAGEERRPDPRLVAGHLLLVELLLWLHNLGPFFAATLTVALGVALLRGPLTRRDWAMLVVGHILVALAWLPGLLILLDEAPTWVKSTWLSVTPREVVGHLQMLYAAPAPAWMAAAALVALAVAGARAAPGGGRLVALLLVLATGPVLLSLLATFTMTPVFITRTVAPVAIPAVLLYALGVAVSEGARRRIALTLAAMLGVTTAYVGFATRARGPIEDWYGTVDWLALRFRPGDAILAYPNEGALPLSYALRDRGLPFPVRPIPAPVPAFATPGAWYPTGSRGVVSLMPARLQAIVDAPETRATPTIWLLRINKIVYDRGDRFLRLLHRDRYIVRSRQAGAIDVVGLRRRPDRP